jgi:hypothetical protein
MSGVEGQQGIEEIGACSGEEWELGADHRADCFGVAGEAETFGVGKATKAGPGFVRREAAELENLGQG